MNWMITTALGILTGWRRKWIAAGMPALREIVGHLDPLDIPKAEKFERAVTVFRRVVESLGGKVPLSEEGKDKMELLIRVVLVLVRWGRSK